MLAAGAGDSALRAHCAPHRTPRCCAGCAGTGKSLLLRHILRVLPPDSTFVTGTTGLAACHLGGTTINSFAGGRAGGPERGAGCFSCGRLAAAEEGWQLFWLLRCWLLAVLFEEVGQGQGAGSSTALPLALRSSGPLLKSGLDWAPARWVPALKRHTALLMCAEYARRQLLAQA